MNMISLNKINKKRLSIMIKEFFPEFYFKIKGHGVYFRKSRFCLFGNKHSVSILELCLHDLPQAMMKKVKNVKTYEKYLGQLDPHTILDIALETQDYTSDKDVIEYLWIKYNEMMGFKFEEKPIYSEIKVRLFTPDFGYFRSIVKNIHKVRTKQIVKPYKEDRLSKFFKRNFNRTKNIFENGKFFNIKIKAFIPNLEY